MHLVSLSPVPSHTQSDGQGPWLRFITPCSLCCAWRLCLFPSWIWMSLPPVGLVGRSKAMQESAALKGSALAEQ